MEANWIFLMYIRRMLHMIEKCPFIQHVPLYIMKGLLDLRASHYQIGEFIFFAVYCSL
jgi:hypothetical protein